MGLFDSGFGTSGGSNLFSGNAPSWGTPSAWNNGAVGKSIGGALAGGGMTQKAGGLFGGGHGIGGAMGPAWGIGENSLGSGSPWAPTGTMPTMTNGDGSLQSKYTVDPSMAATAGYNGAPLSNLEKYASSTTASPWLTNANAMADQSLQTSLGQNATNASNMRSGAELSAASHGGLTGGGDARLGAAAMTSQAGADQGAVGQNALTKNANTVTDWQNKLSVAAGLPGQENAAYTAQEQPLEFDAVQANTAKGQNAQTALGGFGQAMNAYIGNNLASATANTASKKKG